jgi:hypothetical protein
MLICGPKKTVFNTVMEDGNSLSDMSRKSCMIKVWKRIGVFVACACMCTRKGNEREQE